MDGKIINETLKNLELLRVTLMRDEVYLHGDPSYEPDNVVPNKRLQPHFINNYPVFQFCFRGSLPLYDKGNREYRAIIREYYFKAAMNAYEFNSIPFRFNKATIIIQHFFKDKIIRDLDNRNRKFVIDAIRVTGLIKDDNYKVLRIVEEGFRTTEEPYVNVFLLASENFQDFLTYKDEFSQYAIAKERFADVEIEDVKQSFEERKKAVSVHETDNPFWY